MMPLAYLSIFLWIGAAPLLFAVLPKRRAVLAIFLVGFLFLPELHEYQNWGGAPLAMDIRPLSLFFTKANASSYGFLMCLFLFDLPRLKAFRPRWFDLPMVIWCVVPFFSGLCNADVVEGQRAISFLASIISAIQQTMQWGVPYLAGRLYITDWEGLNDLAVAMIMGGLVYVPLCMIEKVLSPQLHNWVWGFFAHDFLQAIRSGYRPMVFMEHGLMVAMWMATTTSMAIWCWWTGAVKTLPAIAIVPPLPMFLVIILLLTTSVLMNSAGALALGLGGTCVLFMSRIIPTRLALVALLAVAPMYMIGRITVGMERTGWLGTSLDADTVDALEAKVLSKRLFGWMPLTGKDVEEKLTQLYNKDRAGSMLYRFKQEDKLMEKALKRPWLGWGGEARGRIFNPRGEDVSTTDGYWILTFGNRGYIGLIAMSLAVLVPAARFGWVFSPRQWANPALAPAAVIAIILCLSLIDDMSNAMIDPFFTLASGALATMTGVKLPTPNIAAALPAPPPQALESWKPPETPEAPETGTQRPGVLRRRLPTGRMDRRK